MWSILFTLTSSSVWLLTFSYLSEYSDLCPCGRTPVAPPCSAVSSPGPQTPKRRSAQARTLADHKRHVYTLRENKRVRTDFSVWVSEFLGVTVTTTSVCSSLALDLIKYLRTDVFTHHSLIVCTCNMTGSDPGTLLSDITSWAHTKPRPQTCRHTIIRTSCSGPLN